MAAMGQLNLSVQAMLGFAMGELVLDALVSTLLVKLACHLYNKTVAGNYDRAGVFEAPSQFDDNPYAPQRSMFQLRDPLAVETPSWGTAATISFCGKLIETLVGMGTFYYLYTTTVQLGPPDPSKIIILTVLLVVGTGFLGRSCLFMMFLPTTFRRGMSLSLLHFVLWLVASLAALLLAALFSPFFQLGAGH